MTERSDWLVVVPTLEEAANIGQLCSDLLALEPAVDVLVVDDHSRDGTAAVVAELARSEPRLHLVERTFDRGRGSAGAAGFAWAELHGYAGVVEMDGDFSHPPSVVPELVRRVEQGYDLAIGSRFVAGASIERRGLGRRVLTRGGMTFARIVLGFRVRDCNSGFRAWSASALARTDAARARSKGPAIVHELLYRATRARLSWVEVPIRFAARRHGQSKLGARGIVAGLWSVLRLRFSRDVAPRRVGAAQTSPAAGRRRVGGA